MIEWKIIHFFNDCPAIALAAGLTGVCLAPFIYLLVDRHDFRCLVAHLERKKRPDMLNSRPRFFLSKYRDLLFTLNRRESNFEGTASLPEWRVGEKPVVNAPFSLDKKISNWEACRNLLVYLKETLAIDIIALVEVRDNEFVLESIQSKHAIRFASVFRKVLTSFIRGMAFDDQSGASGWTEHLFCHGRGRTFLRWSIDTSFTRIIGEGRFILWLGFARPIDARSQRAIIEARLADVAGIFENFLCIADLRERIHTEMRRNEERVKALAFTTHDMRSPLQTIQLVLQSFQRENDVTQREAVESALLNCDHLSELVQNSLEYALLKSGLQYPHPSNIHCEEIISEICKRLEPLARIKRLKFRCDSMPGLQIFADRRHIERILMNIVGNALKYSSEGEVVIFANQLDSRRCSISVRDFGYDSLDRGIYGDRLLQNEEPGNGFGLGLWLVRTLAEINDGELDLARHPEGGAIATILLPISNHFPCSSKEEVRRPCVRILVVDGDVSTSARLQEVLEGADYRIASAALLENARKLIISFKPDFLIIDLALADGSGEVLIVEYLMRQKAIIIVSSRPPRSEYSSLLSESSVFYFRKPVPASTIRQIIFQHAQRESALSAA